MLLTPISKRKNFHKRVFIFILGTAFFLAGFVVNIISNEALFNYNLQIVPQLQANSILGSQSFLVFMNIVSNVFNPILCAGYIIIFYLLSYRKLQILVFLMWFIFLSFFLSLLKQAVHQARPYWIEDGGVQMLQWTCYTQYGCPSGHSMLGIILIEFIIRFFARVHVTIYKYIGIFYFIGFLFEALVMFSRIILGMHSLNQVLFGFMIGVYTFIPYYLFVENFLLKISLYIFRSQKSVVNLIYFITFMFICFAIQVLLTLIPTYDNGSYIPVIESYSRCQNVKLYKSFQYKCFEDSALIMATFGILTAFIYTPNQQNFAKLLNYSRISWKFLAKCLITIVLALIPLAIFLNPLWNEIDTDAEGHAFIIWACQNISFFFGSLFLVYLSSLLGEKLSLQERITPQSYVQFVRFQSTSSFDRSKSSDQQVVRQTQLIVKPQIQQQ